MNSELKITGPSWKVTISIGLFLTLTTIILSLIYHFEFSIILFSIAATIGATGLVFVVRSIAQFFYARQLAKLDIEIKKQDLRLATFQADRAGLESVVLHFSKNERIIMPLNAPVQMIEAVIENNTQLALPASTEQLDLLNVFTQLTQSYAVIGGQQTGKTFQARHIADYWITRNIQPIVIGPKWDRGEWSGCTLLGGKGNFSAVAKGIEVIRQEANKRHADTEKSHKEHSILPVFFDDWTPIVSNVNNARELVLEATTLYASVNIILYFILHSDTREAWGVDNKGAALKDNFVKLFIVPSYDSNGLIVRERTRGFIKFPGNTEEYPAKLFNTSIPASEIVIDRQDISYELEPTEEEQQILELWQQGIRSYREISSTVWPGKFGTHYNKIIESVLQKYGESESKTTESE